MPATWQSLESVVTANGSGMPVFITARITFNNTIHSHPRRGLVCGQKKELSHLAEAIRRCPKVSGMFINPHRDTAASHAKQQHPALSSSNTQRGRIGSANFECPGLEQEVAVEPWSIFRGKNTVITSNSYLITHTASPAQHDTSRQSRERNESPEREELLRQMPRRSITFYRAVKPRAHRA